MEIEPNCTKATRSPGMRPQPEMYPFWHPVDVRFKDIDVGGHAHHSLALVYFEEARAALWEQVAGPRSVDEVDFILAEARVRYHSRVLYPQQLRVGVAVGTLGKKHFVLEYLALGADGNALVSGETTMVMYDYQAGKSKSISLEVRAGLESWRRRETRGG